MLVLTSFHILISLQFLYGSYRFHVLNPEYYAVFDGFGKSMYLTIWNSVFQGVFFAICALNDISETNTRKDGSVAGGTPLIRKIKDFLFASFGFPLSMFVTSTYWVLYAIDRDLVHPIEVDEFLPAWLNHILHTNIAVFTLFELIWSFRIYPKRKTGIRWLTILLIIYTIWTLNVYRVAGEWPYGILIVMSWTQRTFFLGGVIMFMYGLYILGEKLNELMWAEEMKKVEAAVNYEETTTKKKATKLT